MWGEVSRRRRPMGVRERSPRTLRRFYSFFSKKIHIFGIFLPKFLLKNAFFKCLNKVCWCVSKACVLGACPHLLSPLLRHWAWSLWKSKAHCNECLMSFDCRVRFITQFLFNAECQAGKLWIPTFKVLWSDSAKESNPGLPSTRRTLYPRKVNLKVLTSKSYPDHRPIFANSEKVIKSRPGIRLL